MKIFLFRIKFIIKVIVQFLFSFFDSSFCCKICGEKAYVFPVCKKCENKFYGKKLLYLDRCIKCGKILVSEESICVSCRDEPILKTTDFVFPLYSYRLWNKELLCEWKIKGERSLSIFFADKIKNALYLYKKKIVDFSIIPVPPRPGKIKQKGWDQIQEICDLLKYIYGFKILDILVRNSNIEQKKLDRDGRMSTIGKSYEVKDDVNELPGTVCIIDDVMTTGSTIEGISRELKNKGVKTVFAITLFTVDD